MDRNELFDCLLTDNPIPGERVKLPGISDEFMEMCRRWDPVAEMTSVMKRAKKDNANMLVRIRNTLIVYVLHIVSVVSHSLTRQSPPGILATVMTIH